jgi:hypothetical protein
MAPMNTPTDNQKAMVQARLAARARRISLLRRRVVASALASFVLAWGAIATTGSLGATTTTTAAPSVTSADTTTSSSGDSSATTLTPVATSQS